MIKSLDQLEFDHFKFQGGGGHVGAKMRPTIEIKCFHALLCLLTIGVITISDQCDFDHFKYHNCLIIWRHKFDQ